MEAAGWLRIPKIDRTPSEKLAEICLNVAYEGPFELLFYTYYAFPTDYPEDIRSIFGKEFFGQTIQTEAADEFRKTIREEDVQAVVTFNKGIFNLVAEEKIDLPIEKLKAGALIQSKVKDVEVSLPLYLTFPTGWRYDKEYFALRTSSLEKIKVAIALGF